MKDNTTYRNGIRMDKCRKASATLRRDAVELMADRDDAAAKELRNAYIHYAAIIDGLIRRGSDISSCVIDDLEDAYTVAIKAYDRCWHSNPPMFHLPSSFSFLQGDAHEYAIALRLA